jgi:hypothetical protein
MYVFASKGLFASFAEIRTFVDPTYTDDGDGMPAAFIREIDLHDYEPDCIEVMHSKSGQSVPLRDLLADASYSDQWLGLLDDSRLADAAICVFAPNQVLNPRGSSLEYLGCFDYAAA